MSKRLDLTGYKYGKLTVLRPGEDHVQPSGQKKSTWVCVCDCNPNQEIIITTGNLTSGHSKSCGCLNYETKDYTGWVFGKWTVMYQAEPYISPSGYKIQKWHCKCECGIEKDVLQSALITGESQSCGCLKLEHNSENNIDLTNQRFGKWTVIKEAKSKLDSYGRPVRKWLCRCDCGTERDVLQESLCNGLSLSCGCSRNKKTNHQINDVYNTYDLSNEYGIGYTPKGCVFYFDIDDYQLIKDYHWETNNSGYVTSRQVRLHRLIMHVDDPNLMVDHINHDVSDNRKCNLRIVDAYLNSLNSKTPTNNTSGYKGVGFSKQKNKWEAKISVKGKLIHLGFYTNIEDAIMARKEGENKYHREYSYDNSMELAAHNMIKLKERKNAQSQISGHG